MVLIRHCLVCDPSSPPLYLPSLSHTPLPLGILLPPPSSLLLYYILLLCLPAFPGHLFIHSFPSPPPLLSSLPSSPPSPPLLFHPSPSLVPRPNLITCTTPPSTSPLSNVLVQVTIDNWSTTAGGFSYLSDPIYLSIQPPYSFVK